MEGETEWTDWTLVPLSMPDERRDTTPVLLSMPDGWQNFDTTNMHKTIGEHTHVSMHTKQTYMTHTLHTHVTHTHIT